MRRNCLALAMFVFLAASHCQGYNNIESPLNLALTLENITCNESVQFGSGIFEAAKLATFKIDIKNNGKEELRDLEIYTLLPKGANYLNYLYLGGINLDEHLEPLEFDENQNTKIKWNIGGLREYEKKSILIKMYLKCPVKEAQIKLGALGDMSGQSVYNISIWNQSLDKCDCTSTMVKIIESPLKINASSLNNTKCGEWIHFSPEKLERARLETYKIEVQNVGEKPIDDLMVLAVMPTGMKYVASRYSEAEQGKPDMIIEPQEFDDTQKTRIIWNIGRLQPKELRSILLNSYLRCPVNKAYIELGAIGKVAGQSVNATKNESVTSKICDCTNGSIDINLNVWEANNNTTADFSIGCLEQAKLNLYNISVTNKGEISLNNVKIIAELPKGMMFVNSSYYDSWRGKLNASKSPDVFDENRKTSLVWSIGDLLPWEKKSIVLAIFLKNISIDKDIFAMVQGYSPFLPENEPIIDFADPASNACSISIRDELGNKLDEGEVVVAQEMGKKLNKINECLPWTENINLTELIQSQKTGITAKDCANISIFSEIYEADNNTTAYFGQAGSVPARFDILNITINNSGIFPLNDVEANAILAEGMIFNNNSSSDIAWDMPNVEIDPKAFRNLKWKIGSLQPEEKKTILLETYIKKDLDIEKNIISVNVTGSLQDGSRISASTDRAVPKKYL